MKLFIAILGMILVVAWAIERWYVRNTTEEQHQRDQAEPPGDGSAENH